MPPDDENDNIPLRITGSPTSGSVREKGHSKGGWLSYLPPEIQMLITRWRSGAKHELCRHQHSCVASVVEVKFYIFLELI